MLKPSYSSERETEHHWVTIKGQGDPPQVQTPKMLKKEGKK